MTTKVQKWGNSLAVRLPKRIVDRLDLVEGGEVVVKEDGSTITILPKGQKRHHLRDWKKFIIPSGKKEKKNVSEHIDRILYEKASRR